MNYSLHLRAVVARTTRAAVGLSLVVLGGLIPLAGRCSAQDQAAPALKPQDRRVVIDRAATVLRERYVFPQVAEHVAAALLHAERRGEFASFTDPETFASAVSGFLQERSGDGHLWIGVHPGEYPEPATDPDPVPTETQRRSLAKSNFGFPHVEVLAGNVGYLKIHQFVASELGADAASAAMQFLSNTDALLIDLRESMGGSPDMVALLSSYLFGPEPVHLFDVYRRPEERTDQYFTYRDLPGSRLRDQPVFVLTQPATFSAGEGLAYVLKHLGRATVVGERTAGGAHPGRFHRINSDFVMFVAEARATSPVTGDNWQGRGVDPDVEVPAEHALDTAHLLALEALREVDSGSDIAEQRLRAAEAIRERLPEDLESRR